MSLEEQLGVLAKEAEELGYLDMAVVNTKGIAKYAIGGDEADLSERDYVQNALVGKAGFSDVMVSKVTNSTVIMFAAPIKLGDEVVGALIGRRSGVALNEIAKGMTFGEKGSAFILGNDGTFYAHNDDTIVMEQRNVIKEIEENGEFKDFGIKFDEFRIGKEDNFNYTLNGEEFVASLEVIPNTDWVLALKAPQSQISKGINGMTLLLVVFSIVFIAAGAVVAFILGKSISKPITHVVDLLNNMSQYDMSIENNDKANKYINRADEIGIMANATLVLQDNLRTLIESIARSAEHIAAASEELTATTQQAAESANEVAGAVQDIASGAADQASDTEKGANEIENLGDLIEQDKKLIIELNGLTNQVERLKGEGLDVLNILVAKTEMTNKTATEVRNVILETNESANKIDNASQMILNIANQTNLLALNAAIEAARAGEQGKGFAVVADEIRKLADQTNRFTSEIAKDIEELTGKSQFAVKAMAEVGDNLKEQTNSVDFTNTKFEGIAAAIENLKNLIHHLNQQSKEMDTKKDEIVGIIQNLSAISEENAAGTEEATASIEEQTSSMNEIANSSESLSGLAEDMQKSISKFKM
jgi:methyl-accepting chemotaxis protein